MDLDPPSQSETPQREWSPATRRLLIAAVGFIVFTASVSASSLVLANAPDESAWAAIAISLMLVVVVLVVMLAGVREVMYWRLPLDRLAATVAQVRLGAAPIAELDKATGGARRVSPAIRDVLIDRRELRRQMQIANVESDRKVAAATDSLERKLGVIKQQSTRDGLTGLFNRRAMDEMLPTLIDRAKQQGEDLGVLMIDVDYFKVLNDTLGHAQGDEFLRQLGEIIRSILRDERDMAFRFGGDEFAVAFRDADLHSLQDIAHRLKQMVESASHAFASEPRPAISCGGASTGGSSVIDAKSLLSKADAALYEIKHSRPSGPKGSKRSAA